VWRRFRQVVRENLPRYRQHSLTAWRYPHVGVRHRHRRRPRQGVLPVPVDRCERYHDGRRLHPDHHQSVRYLHDHTGGRGRYRRLLRILRGLLRQQVSAGHLRYRSDDHRSRRGGADHLRCGLSEGVPELRIPGDAGRTQGELQERRDYHQRGDVCRDLG